MKYKILCIIVILLILADGGITYWAVSSGIAEEANPNVVELIEDFGLEKALLYAASVKLATVALGMIVQYKSGIFKWVMPTFMIFTHSIPVIWNIVVLLPLL